MPHLRTATPRPALLLLCLCTALAVAACDDEPATRAGDAADLAQHVDTVSPADTNAPDTHAPDSHMPDTHGLDTPGADTRVSDTAANTDAPADTSAPTGGAAWRGAVLFFEPFEDADFGARGWYDDSSGVVLSSAEHVDTGARAFECQHAQGASSCTGGTPGRHLFDGQDAVYLSYYVAYSDNYVGSQRPYHPHELHFITDVDDKWIGPSTTHLTTYIEQVGGFARLALQDSLNVDTACILRNDDTFVGCSGDFASYLFTEQRSVCACNGLLGELQERDCFDAGATWYSARGWTAAAQTFRDAQGPYYKGDWHFVEVVFAMNSVVGGVGQADGAIRYWLDGELLIASDTILMRTGQHPDMRFNQFLIAPYIGDGSPVDQTTWIDDLTVAVAQRP